MDTTERSPPLAPFGRSEDHLEAESAWVRLLLARWMQRAPKPGQWPTAALSPHHADRNTEEFAWELAQQRELIEARLAQTQVEMLWPRLQHECDLDPATAQMLLLLWVIDNNPRLKTAVEHAYRPFDPKPPGMTFLLELLGLETGGIQAVLKATARRGRLCRHGIIQVSRRQQEPIVALSPIVARALVELDEQGLFLPEGIRVERPTRGLIDVLPDAQERHVVIEALRSCGPTPHLLLSGATPEYMVEIVSGLVADTTGVALMVPIDAPSQTHAQAKAWAFSHQAAVTLLPARPEHGDAQTDDVLAGYAGLQIPFYAVLRNPMNAHRASRHVQQVVLNHASGEMRRALWLHHWPSSVPAVEPEVLGAIAAAFPLPPAGIERACGLLQRRRRRWSGGAPTRQELAALASEVAAPDFGGLAALVESPFGWSDVVLDERTREGCREIETFVAHRQELLEDWNLKSLLPYGRSVGCLFHGPPGTGKTMVAGVIARSMGRSMFVIDLSQVVDKYVGETEKRLGRIFDEAADSGAVLLFDEADALFSRRTEVKSSSDKYANLEVNFLLQRIEQFDGLIILTTNFEQGLDEALRRRLRFFVHFPEPDRSMRERLWRTFMLPTVPQTDIRWDALARSFELTPAHIKNAVVRACAFALAQRQPVGFDHLWSAASAEYRTLGRVVPNKPKPSAQESGRHVR
ncbi:MAG: ATP-binding protein [Myxococcota bacterium]